MKLLRFVAIFGLALGLPLLALAQNGAVVSSVKPNTPFTVAWDFNTAALAGDVPTFRWWCDAAIVKNFAPADLTVGQTPNADGTTTYQAIVPGLKPGLHTCTVSAFTAAFPADQQSAPLGVPAGVQPGVPSNLRIIQVTIVVGGGGQ